MLLRPIKTILSKELWRTIGNYTGFSKIANLSAIDDIESLKYFINSRSSHVAQSALYGYLKTRAGTRFPEMFENPKLLASMNIAKWQIWLACISDLSTYMGGLVYSQSKDSSKDLSNQIANTIVMITASLFAEVDYKEQQKEEFESNQKSVLEHLKNCDYSIVTDDEMAFSSSPKALYQWAPIATELKRYDKEIVENSVRFRWQEIRHLARKKLNATTLIATL